MRCLVTYDVDQPHHAAVKAQCIRAGFRDYVEMPDRSRKQLPNTTLIVEAVDAEDAVNKFKAQVRLVTPNGLMSLPSLSCVIKSVIGVEYTRHHAENEGPPGNALEAYRRQQSR